MYNIYYILYNEWFISTAEYYPGERPCQLSGEMALFHSTISVSNLCPAFRPRYDVMACNKRLLGHIRLSNEQLNNQNYANLFQVIYYIWQ